jgi:restriction system protein
MWMVRAGEGGYLIDEFARGFVAIGREDVGDLSEASTQEQVRVQYEAAYPGEKPGKANNAIAGVLAGRMRSGSYVSSIIS